MQVSTIIKWIGMVAGCVSGWVDVGCPAIAATFIKIFPFYFEFH